MQLEPQGRDQGSIVRLSVREGVEFAEMAKAASSPCSFNKRTPAYRGPSQGRNDGAIARVSVRGNFGLGTSGVSEHSFGWLPGR